MFIIALVHAIVSLIQFHALGDVSPLVALFTSNPNYDSISQFPFQIFGFFALLILFLMAATSHDFWLENLSPRIWKALHMMVYVAYGLVVAHVALGVLQYETHPILTIALGAGLVWILGLHLWAALKESGRDVDLSGTDLEDWVDVCAVDDIAEKRGKVVTVSGERLAVFRYDGKISVMS